LVYTTSLLQHQAGFGANAGVALALQVRADASVVRRVRGRLRSPDGVVLVVVVIIIIIMMMASYSGSHRCNVTADDVDADARSPRLRYCLSCCQLDRCSTPCAHVHASRQCRRLRYAPQPPPLPASSLLSARPAVTSVAFTRWRYL